jgi:hypothetical protein
MPDAVVKKNQDKMLEMYNSFVNGLTTMSMGKKGFNRGMFSSEDLLNIQSVAGQIMKEYNTIKQNEGAIIDQYDKYQKNPDIYDPNVFSERWKIAEETGLLPEGGLLRTTRGDLNTSINAIQNKYKDNIKQVERNVGNKTIVSSEYVVPPEVYINEYGNLLQDERNVKAITHNMILFGDPEEIVRNIEQIATPEESLVLTEGLARVYQQSQIGGLDVFTRDLEDNPIMQQIAAQWGEQNVMPSLFPSRIIKETPYKPAESGAEDQAWRVTNKTLLDGQNAENVVHFNKEQTLPVDFDGTLTPIGGGKLPDTGQGTLRFSDIKDGYIYGTIKAPVKEVKTITAAEKKIDDNSPTQLYGEFSLQPDGKYKGEIETEKVIKVKVPVAKYKNELLSKYEGLPLDYNIAPTTEGTLVTKNTPTYTSTQRTLINKTMEENPGVTEEEVVEYLKKYFKDKGEEF